VICRDAVIVARLGIEDHGLGELMMVMNWIVDGNCEIAGLEVHGQRRHGGFVDGLMAVKR
jgi:hypothetical protein